MKRVVLFDLGNTLIRYYERPEFPGILEQAINGVQDYLYDVGLFDLSSGSIWWRVEKENHEAKDHRVRPLEGRLTRIFQLDNPTDETVMTMCRLFMEPIFAISHCYEDALPVLQELGERGIKRAIVSNTAFGSPANLWKEEIARFGLDRHVDAAFFCRDAGWRKPARQIFDFVLDKLRVSPQDCVFVGDDPRWDLVGPRAVGIDAILIDRRGTMQDTGAEPIRNLYELITRLRVKTKNRY